LENLLMPRPGSVPDTLKSVKFSDTLRLQEFSLKDKANLCEAAPRTLATSPASHFFFSGAPK
jgi:hypothetical protein